MKTTAVPQVQNRVLFTLYRRTMTRKKSSYASRTSIQRELRLPLAEGYLHIVLDGLVEDGRVQTNTRGHYRLSVAGVEFAQKEWGFAIDPIHSVEWTGSLDRHEVSAASRERISQRLRAIEAALEDLPLTQTERANAKAYLLATIALSEAPDPPWELIIKLLGVLGGLGAIASAITDVLSMIRAT